MKILGSMAKAQSALASEVQPIDDVRSTQGIGAVWR
jgi:hypothetical protein